MSAEHTPTPPAPKKCALCGGSQGERGMVDALRPGFAIPGGSAYSVPCPAVFHITPPAPADDAGRIVVKSPRPCPDCDGTGWLAGDPCPLCSGLAPGEREDARLKHQRAVEKARRADDAGGAEAWARRFHDTYERLAPSFGYETRKETRQFDPSSPNGRLMIAVCAALQLPAHDDAVVEAARAVVESVPAYFWNDYTPAKNSSVAYAIDYARLDALRAALRAKGGA